MFFFHDCEKIPPEWVVCITKSRRDLFAFLPVAKIKELPPSSWRQARLHQSLAYHFRIRPNAEKVRCESIGLFLVGEDGFEPSKRNAADLQSVPFGHSGTPPYSIICFLIGAGRRTRTPDLLITNQLLYQLSYTGSSNRT